MLSNHHVPNPIGVEVGWSVRATYVRISWTQVCGVCGVVCGVWWSRIECESHIYVSGLVEPKYVVGRTHIVQVQEFATLSQLWQLSPTHGSQFTIQNSRLTMYSLHFSIHNPQFTIVGHSRLTQPLVDGWLRLSTLRSERIQHNVVDPSPSRTITRYLVPNPIG